MQHTQTIDLCDDRTLITEQHAVLARLEAISSRGALAWSDDDELHSLMLRYEHTSSVASSRWLAS